MSTLRKTGAQTASIGAHTPPGHSNVGAVVNRGLIHVAGGTLRTPQTPVTFTVTNRGTVQVDAGAIWDGALASDGGTVQGAGTVQGNVTFAGTGNHLRPGASPGTLTVAGPVALNSGTTLHTELNGNTPVTGHDQLAVAGTVDLGGATLELTLGAGYPDEFEEFLKAWGKL